ncbi:aldehyde dehydrogenase [Mycobacterium sp. IS-2888]|uniref:aldehyde dehydrogenase family protein n=1 Tax=unclassified Mycobacterium TaxID=2642494 RepID=UPI00096D7883|nr:MULTISPECIES: aldehyde dehydrogenase family protein [unclassified Mycobacterium]OMC45166.1 aldehyde dehydrogenase [Mycobacterium sp. IS-2888]OMC47755.1 aldehyde dehydrogenase [Mycobacterium sp. IS-1264]
MTITQSFIDGESVASADLYDNIDPATGRSLGPVARGGTDEVDRAVTAARPALQSWRGVSPAERATLLTRVADLIDHDHERLARIESEDTGKPLSQARADATVAARYFRFYGHAIDSYYGQTIPLSMDLHAYTRREPFGVTGHIVAWNYPMQLLARAVAPAIAVGNCAVVKPADETPRTAVELARLAVQAGLPHGVFNVVTGIGAEAGAALTAHPEVDHLGFVGSTQIGSVVAHAAADRVVPTTLELGGKSPQIVFPDAHLDRAAESIVKAILQNAGQTCSAGSRLLAHDSIHDNLVDTVCRLMESATIGPGIDDRDLGPLISHKQQQRVQSMVGGDIKGEIRCGGGPPEDARLADGAYFAPTVIADVDPASPIAQEEIFGPVLTVNRFFDEDEAISLANGTQYGLIAAVWTTDLSRAHRLAAEIQAGQVYVNTYGAGGGVELPFGGFKKSGYGREKGYQALDTFTTTKTVVVRLE